MGSGEPLDNWEATISFLEAVKDPQRLGLVTPCYTVNFRSGSGMAAGCLRLALKFAVSLHAPNNEIRNQLMPINKSIPGSITAGL